MFALVAVVAYVLDQATKVWAVQRLEGESPITLIRGVFELGFVRNPGAAFGMGESITPVLTVSMVVIAGAVVVAAAKMRHPGWAIALGLLLGGALGNITDRIFREPGPFRGHVVDFLHLNHWPVFNFADSAITVAAVLVVILSWRGIGLDGTTSKK
ncbi:MAG: signal peptidase II [Propionibacteriales bacterium]|nr:signal peptidase II [Propionibacteriales bacterium]